MQLAIHPHRAAPALARVTVLRRLLLAVGALYLMAWYLPSIDIDLGPFIGDVRLNGLQVTAIAFTPHLYDPGADAGAAPWERMLAMTSALTNVLFVATWVLAWRRTARPLRWAPVALAVAAAFNLWLLVRWSAAGAASGLRSGYYLWLAAFLAFAL